MVQGRRSGKFFSPRTSGIQVGGLVPNFEVATRKLKHSQFQRPCRGRSPGKGFAPTKRNQIACRDDKAILYSTSSGANCSEYAWRIFQKIFHKNEHISRSCLRISLRSCQVQEKTHSASDGASGKSAIFFLAENEWYQGRRFGPKFRGHYMKIEAF